MPASVRFEVFPSDLDRCIKFYTEVLRFTLRRHEPASNYAYMQRDAIFIGAVETKSSDFPNEEGPQLQYRIWPTGVEIVFEVDNLDEERQWVMGKSWLLDEDIKMQPWGLRDFRLRDPDGYYIRITTKGNLGKSPDK